jgi:hypothetical protein
LFFCLNFFGSAGRRPAAEWTIAAVYQQGKQKPQKSREKCGSGEFRFGTLSHGVIFCSPPFI